MAQYVCITTIHTVLRPSPGPQGQYLLTLFFSIFNFTTSVDLQVSPTPFPIDGKSFIVHFYVTQPCLGTHVMAISITYHSHISLMTYLFSLLSSVSLHASILSHLLWLRSKLGSTFMILVHISLMSPNTCLTIFGFYSVIYLLDTTSHIDVTTLIDEVSWASCNNNNSSNNTAVNLDKLVVNLSDTNITHTQKLLLSRGLKFCPRTRPESI